MVSLLWKSACQQNTSALTHWKAIFSEDTSYRSHLLQACDHWLIDSKMQVSFGNGFNGVAREKAGGAVAGKTRSEVSVRPSLWPEQQRAPPYPEARAFIALSLQHIAQAAVNAA